MNKYTVVLEKVQEYDAVNYKVTNPQSIIPVIENVFNLSNQSEEVLVVLALSTKGDVVGAFEVHRGSLNQTLLHPREIFKRVMLVNGASFIVAHNHPSGNPSPSNQDFEVTRVLHKGGQLLDIEMLDHLIIGFGGKTFSFREHSAL